MNSNTGSSVRGPAAGALHDADSPAAIVFVPGLSFSGSTLMDLIPGSHPVIVLGGDFEDHMRRIQSPIRGSGWPAGHSSVSAE